jgi:hypothetical protein
MPFRLAAQRLFLMVRAPEGCVSNHESPSFETAAFRGLLRMRTIPVEVLE